MKNSMNLIRKAFHSGTWYVSDPALLDQELQTNLMNAKLKIDPNFQKNLKALIGPHAGFRYSGPNAAWAYKNIVNQEQYDTVFILGPSHKVYLDFVATT